MECSAREYSRTSIISNSDISPPNTKVSVNQVRNSRKKLLSKNDRNRPCYDQARDETKPSFDPQFLQKRASAGLAVLQFSQIFDTWVVPVRGVTSGHGRT